MIQRLRYFIKAILTKTNTFIPIKKSTLNSLVQKNQSLNLYNKSEYVKNFRKKFRVF